MVQDFGANKMLDIMICIMPRIEPDAPTAGAGVLKSHLIQAGYACEVIDLNIKLYNYLDKKGIAKDIFFKKAMMFSNQPQDCVNTDFENFYQEHSDIFYQWIDIFRKKNPKWIGMSLLSAFSCAASLKLSEIIKKELPHIRIVWGGTNIQHKGFFSPIEKGYIDAFIKGDGERSIIELLRDNWNYPGINTVDEIDEVIPYDLSLGPDYDDIDWSEYHNQHSKNPIYVTASRGCVRKCTFCNDWQIWPTYRFKNAKKVAEEVDYLKGKHDRTTIMFTDSLLNGSLSNFRNIVEELKKVKEKYNDKPFGWNSHLICRPKHQMPESDYKLMAESGCVGAVIGIESFSPSVREHMGKKYTNEDIYFMIEMLVKYDIRAQLLILIGYVNETEEDHKMNLDAIDYIFGKGWGYKKDPAFEYKRPLVRWTIGNSLLIDKNHLLFDMIKDDADFEYKTAMNWRYKDNDMAVRLRRWKETIARVQYYDNDYKPNHTTERTIIMTEKRLENPNGPKFWSE